jgi:hypothetical protein
MDKMEQTFIDLERTCEQCGGRYTWTIRDQRFSQHQGYLPPKYCAQCRAAKKALRRGTSAHPDGDAA